MVGPPVRGRKCGSCTLCCTLLPVVSLDKGANTRCRHQSWKGCRIYPDRPFECRFFSCRWLIDESAGKMRRPDKTGYVIDPALDVAKADETVLPVIQIWIDPKREDAHEDPLLRAWLDRQGAEHGVYALLRWGSSEAALLAPPSLTGAGWFMSERQPAQASWSAAERFAMLDGG
jgi:hypothetical protein